MTDDLEEYRGRRRLEVITSSLRLPLSQNKNVIPNESRGAGEMRNLQDRPEFKKILLT